MQPRRAKIDLGNGTLTLEDNVVLPLGPLSDRSSLVRTTTKQVIPAASVCAVQVRVGKSYDEQILLEPTLTTSDNVVVIY